MTQKTQELGLTKEKILTLVADGYVFANENRQNQIFLYIKED